MLVRDLIEALHRLPQDDVVDVDNLESESAAQEITFKDPDAYRESIRDQTVVVRRYAGLSALYLVTRGS